LLGLEPPNGEADLGSCRDGKAKRTPSSPVIRTKPEKSELNFPNNKMVQIFCFFCMIIPTAEGYDFSFKVRNFRYYRPFVVNFCFSSYVMPIL